MSNEVPANVKMILEMMSIYAPHLFGHDLHRAQAHELYERLKLYLGDDFEISMSSLRYYAEKIRRCGTCLPIGLIESNCRLYTDVDKATRIQELRRLLGQDNWHVWRLPRPIQSRVKIESLFVDGINKPIRRRSLDECSLSGYMNKLGLQFSTTLMLKILRAPRYLNGFISATNDNPYFYDHSTFTIDAPIPEGWFKKYKNPPGIGVFKVEQLQPLKRMMKKWSESASIEGHVLVIVDALLPWFEPLKLKHHENSGVPALRVKQIIAVGDYILSMTEEMLSKLL